MDEHKPSRQCDRKMTCVFSSFVAVALRREKWPLPHSLQIQRVASITQDTTIGPIDAIRVNETLDGLLGPEMDGIYNDMLVVLVTP